MTISNNYPTVRPSLLLDFANAKALDPRISFIRSTTGTYYDGVTQALAEQNLLTNSNTITTGANFTATQGTADPLGGTSAWNVVETTSTTVYGRPWINGQSYYPKTGVTATLSVWVKAGIGSPRYIVLSSNIYNNGEFCSFTFDPVAGTFTSGVFQGSWVSSPSATATVLQTSGSWYRIGFTFTPASTQPLGIWIGMSNVSRTTSTNAAGQQNYTGDGTSNIYVYGAVFEERATPISYQPNYQTTTTRPISNYIPQLLTAAINQPRFDFDPVTGLSMGLLIERSQTNVITYSQDFTQSIYTKTNITAANAQNIAPDGTLSANTLTETTATGYHQFSLTQITYSQSFFFKPNGRNFVSFSSTSNPTANNYQIFNLSTGALGAGAGFRTDVPPQIYAVGNGWYRCFVVNQSATLYVSFSNDGTTWSYTGDGYSGVYVWGAQSDQQGSLHSYIPTNGAAVTCSYDVAMMTGTNFSSWFNNGQGTFYAEQYNQGGYFDAFAYILSVDDGVNSLSNTIQLKKGTPASPYIVGTITNSTTSVYSQTLLTAGNFVPSYSQSDPASTIVKVALSYSNTSTSGKANSATALTTTPTAIPPALNRLSIGNAAGNTLIGQGNSVLYGWMKKLVYYPVQTTVAQITGLTSS